MAHTAPQFQDPSEVTEGLLWTSGLQFGLLALYEIGTLFPWQNKLTICLGFSLLFTVVVAIMLPVLTRRYRGNAEALYPGSQLRMSGAMAGWSWFIPVGSLWLPYQAIASAWRASAKNGAGVGPIRLWWLARLGATVAMLVAGKSHSAAVVLIWLVLRVLSLGAFVRVARQLCRWQNHDNEQRTLAGAVPAPAA